MREEKERLQDLVKRQTVAITALERQLRAASFSSNEQHFRDCAQAYKSGHNTSGVYHIYIGDMTEPTKGFGDLSGEHWLGNEAVHLITSQAQYSLRVELKDWEENGAYALYDKFQLASEKQQYRLLLGSYSGTAGQQSWWFDACGLSNLNGIYYTVGHNIRKLNGIKWHHFRGPSYSLQSTSMMIRPADF
ncbi:hypothetical protein cypCar_00008618 [Cyprinus carpio]|nr:hypothetical protein cypCar_00008618 [Cyprinus carpio]